MTELYEIIIQEKISNGEEVALGRLNKMMMNFIQSLKLGLDA